MLTTTVSSSANAYFSNLNNIVPPIGCVLSNETSMIFLSERTKVAISFWGCVSHGAILASGSSESERILHVEVAEDL